MQSGGNGRFPEPSYNTPSIEGKDLMSVTLNRWFASLAATLALGATAQATIPYAPVPIGAVSIGPGVADPKEIFGKEYSHDFDQTTLGPGGLPDAQQVIAWDGSGGTGDGVDFTGTRPSWTPDQEIDAIANHNDALYNEIKDDRAHLVFSHDDEVAFLIPGAGGGFVPGLLPAGGPVFLSNGNAIGGAGEVSVEKAGFYHGPEDQTFWASQAEVNGMPLPRDVDGLELFGMEPGFAGDTDKYSLDLDFASGTSVWNGSGSSYIPHASIVSAVTTLLGPIPGGAFLPFDNQEFINAINLDALMVRDVIGSEDVFDGDPTGAANPSDEIIFSIRQILDPSDPSGYYSTGSELFVLDGSGGVSFLDHGGHVWDKAYALGSLSVFDPNMIDTMGVIDINAIEAIGQRPIPEPVGATLLLGGMATMAVMRWRLG